MRRRSITACIRHTHFLHRVLFPFKFYKRNFENASLGSGQSFYEMEAKRIVSESADREDLQTYLEVVQCAYIWRLDCENYISHSALLPQTTQKLQEALA